MRKGFFTDASGSAALEFTILAPVSVSLVFGAIALGFAAWNKNVLQEVAYETARCVALSGPSCATVSNGCDSNVPGFCFAIQRAADRGMGLKSTEITLNANATIGGFSFTTISITYPFNVAGYRVPLSAYATFPNGG
jgi:hypothetical protein